MRRAVASGPRGSNAAGRRAHRGHPPPQNPPSLAGSSSDRAGRRHVAICPPPPRITYAARRQRRGGRDAARVWRGMANVAVGDCPYPGLPRQLLRCSPRGVFGGPGAARLRPQHQASATLRCDGRDQMWMACGRPRQQTCRKRGRGGWGQAAHGPPHWDTPAGYSLDTKLRPRRASAPRWGVGSVGGGAPIQTRRSPTHPPPPTAPPFKAGERLWGGWGGPRK